MYLTGKQFKQVILKAKRERYGIIASNCANDVIIKGLVQGAERARADELIQISTGAARFESGSTEDMKVGVKILAMVVREVAGQYKNCGIATHIDHCRPKDFDWLKYVIENDLVGSVMIDASDEPFDRNVEITKEVVALAHPRGILVEGEIGRIKGIEDDVEAAESILTKPEEALEYVAQTQVDLFAAAVGTSHGVSKGKKMKLRLDLVKEIDDLLTKRGLEAGIVLHGATGLTVEQQETAVRNGVVKINKDTRYQQVFAETIQKYWEQNKDAVVPPEGVSEDDFTADKKRFDPRAWLKLVQGSVEDAVVQLVDIVGGTGKSITVE